MKQTLSSYQNQTRTFQKKENNKTISLVNIGVKVLNKHLKINKCNPSHQQAKKEQTHNHFNK